MIEIPKCPNCDSDTAPDLIKVNILESGSGASTYEEFYECKCGRRYVALVPRVLEGHWRHIIDW